MGIKDINRLNYKPNIDRTKEIYTNYDGEIDARSINKDTPPEETKLDNNPYSNVSPALVSCLINNIGITFKGAIKRIKEIDNAIMDKRSIVMKDDNLAPLLDGIEQGDLKALDKYIELAENISGRIDSEVYPMLVNTRNEMKRFIDYINKLLFNNNIDYNDIESFIEKYHATIQSIIDLEKRMLSGEVVDGYIDYRMFSVDVQLYRLVDDRIATLNTFADKLINPDSNPIAFIPPEQGLLQDYYDELLRRCNDSMEGMTSFDSTDVVYMLLDKIYNQRQKVKRNRDLLLNADRKSFFSMLPMAKDSESKLDEYILDLYKANACDGINKGDYLSSLFVKNDLRQYIVKNI